MSAIRINWKNIKKVSKVGENVVEDRVENHVRNEENLAKREENPVEREERDEREESRAEREENDLYLENYKILHLLKSSLLNYLK